MSQYNDERFMEIVNRRGDSLTDVAAVLGISATSLWKKRTRRVEFTRKEIVAFCEHYGCKSPMGIFF